MHIAGAVKKNRPEKTLVARYTVAVMIFKISSDQIEKNFIALHQMGFPVCDVQKPLKQTFKQRYVMFIKPQFIYSFNIKVGDFRIEDIETEFRTQFPAKVNDTDNTFEVERRLHKKRIDH